MFVVSSEELHFILATRQLHVLKIVNFDWSKMSLIKRNTTAAARSIAYGHVWRMTLAWMLLNILHPDWLQMCSINCNITVVSTSFGGGHDWRVALDPGHMIAINIVHPDWLKMCSINCNTTVVSTCFGCGHVWRVALDPDFSTAASRSCIVIGRRFALILSPRVPLLKIKQIDQRLICS